MSASLPPELETLYVGDSPWTTAQKSAEETVLSQPWSLQLSPSSIQQWLFCPRQFFYQVIAGLPESQSPLKEPRKERKAIFGTLVHKTLELFYRQCDNPLDTSFIQSLITTLFEDTPSHWSPTEKAKVKELPKLMQTQLQAQLQSAFDELIASGFFEKQPPKTDVEVTLETQPLPQFPHIKLTGRIDALRHHGPGQVEILDYKTSESAYQKVKPESNLKEILGALAPDTEGEINAHADFQLPLYGWMLKQTQGDNAPQIALTIQTVRPKKAGSKGILTLTVPASQFNTEAQAYVERVLKQDVLAPMLALENFPALASDCSYCAYQSICEGPTDPEGEDDAEFDS